MQSATLSINSRSHDAVIRVYDESGNVIETHEHAGEFKGILLEPGGANQIQARKCAAGQRRDREPASTKRGWLPELPENHEGTTMKKQINPSTKARLLRSALILLSLLAICAIPFALADIVLYDQLNNPGTSATSSEEQLGSPQFTDFAADDFFVPSGETWVITEVDAQGVNGVVVPENFNVFFYQIGSGGLPGTQVYAATAQPYLNNAGVFQVTLTAPAVLTTGNYFVSVQAHISGSENPTWRWMDRIGQAGALAAWQNLGGGFNSCFTWGARITCVGDAGAPGQMFRIIGTIGAFGTPSPTPTGTPSPSATGTPSPSATCARPTPGSCVSYEAEDNTLTGSAFVLSCPTCSEEEKVGYVGNNSGTAPVQCYWCCCTGHAQHDDLLHQRRRGALRPSEREWQSSIPFDLSVHWLFSDCGVNTDDRRFEHRLQHA